MRRDPPHARGLGEQEPSGLAINDWVITEFSAALAMKLRSGEIEAIHRAEALAHPAQHRQLLGLRAGDALHLAICADHGATLCTTGSNRRRLLGGHRRSS